MEEPNYTDTEEMMEFVEEKIDTEVLYEQDTNEFDKFCIKELEVEAAQSEVSRQFDLQLINSIKKYENLYASKRRITKEAVARDWESVAEECNTTVEKVKYRWKLLRGYFSAEKKKRKLEVKINAQNLFTRQHFNLYEDMLFIDKYVKPRRSFKVCQSHITFDNNEADPLIFEDDPQNQANNGNTSNSEEFALNNDESEDNSYMEEFLLNDVLNPELIDLDNLLINHVRKYRFLYDKTNRFEQRSDLHDHTWAKIAKACGVTEKYAKERWCRLRAYYVRARKKRGCNNGDINGKSTFFFFDSMQFLDEHIQYRRNYSNKKMTGLKQDPTNDDSSENYEIWSQNVLKLDKMIIDAVKSHPNLYDRSHASYGHSLVANNSWAAVSAQCGETEDFVKIRWARLRGYFVKEMRKVDLRHDNSTRMPKRNFPFWDDMKFLKKHIKKRKVFYTSVPNDKNSSKKNGNKVVPERQKLNDTSNKDIKIIGPNQSIETPVEQFKIFQHKIKKNEEDVDFESNMESDNNSEQSELENEDADLDLLLIELVRRNPHLYNKKKKTPEEMIKINSTWSEIAKKCDIEENYAKCRWQTLRKYYSSENRRMKLNGCNQPRKFPFFEIMNFLDGYVELRRNFKTEPITVTQNIGIELSKDEQEHLDRNLIECISNYPNIWKQKKGNKDLVPDSIWNEIGEKCGITADLAKNRWEYLKKHANDIDAEPNFITNQDQQLYNVNFFNEMNVKPDVSSLEIENSESTQDSCKDRNNFNIDSDLLLIRTIRAHSVLYVYKRSVSEKSKEDAWSQVAKECNISVEYAKSRWCRLRSYYTSWKKRRELVAKKQNHTMTKRNFPFWEDMKFLDKYIKKRNRKGLFEQKIKLKEETVVAEDRVDLTDIKISPQETCFDSVLVDLVEKHRYLYDYTHLFYGNAQKTKEAWTKIGKICSLTPDEAKSRWRLIRKYYVKSKKRVSSSSNIDCTEKKRHLVKLSFLDQFIRHRSFFGRKIQKPETSVKNLERVEAYSDAYYEEESRERDENDRFLIKCVEQHSVLYNRKDPAFADERCKQDAWESVGKLCNKTAKECIKRWTLLRRYFTYEKRKLEPRHQDDTHLPRRNFPFYEDMLFLTPFILPRKNLRKLVLSNPEEEEEEEENFEEITNVVTDTNVSVDSSQNENSQQSEEAVMSTGNNPESDIQIIFIYNNKDEQFSPLEITKINKSSENLSEFLMLSHDSN